MQLPSGASLLGLNRASAIAMRLPAMIINRTVVCAARS
jgi:hypothetical protein